MTQEELGLWQCRNGLTAVSAAKYFGVTERNYHRWLKGESPIPKYVPIIVALLNRIEEKAN